MFFLKRFWWAINASIKGMSYEEYLLHRRSTLERKLAELPETVNCLSALREYYGLKSLRRTLAVLTPSIVISLVTLSAMVWQPEHARSCVGILIGVWVSQLMLISIGFSVRKRYPD